MEESRVRFTVRYDGTDFLGSQLQPEGRTVAGTLKTELEELLNQEIKLLMAGRTDTGVHADGNVCAFDAKLPFPAEKLPIILNPRLPDDIEIRDAESVDQAFHPRFDAIKREYVYRFFHAEHIPVDRHRYVVKAGADWDYSNVDDCFKALVGEHMFINFAKGDYDSDDTVCFFDDVSRSRAGAEEHWVFKANRFLRHQICRLVGALIEVAEGRVSSDDFIEAIDGKLNFKFRPAPAKGLTLKMVVYQPPKGEDSRDKE